MTVSDTFNLSRKTGFYTSTKGIIDECITFVPCSHPKSKGLSDDICYGMTNITRALNRLSFDRPLMRSMSSAAGLLEAGLARGTKAASLRLSGFDAFTRFLACFKGSSSEPMFAESAVALTGAETHRTSCIIPAPFPSISAEVSLCSRKEDPHFIMDIFSAEDPNYPMIPQGICFLGKRSRKDHAHLSIYDPGGSHSWCRGIDLSGVWPSAEDFIERFNAPVLGLLRRLPFRYEVPSRPHLTGKEAALLCRPMNEYVMGFASFIGESRAQQLDDILVELIMNMAEYANGGIVEVYPQMGDPLLSGIKVIATDLGKGLPKDPNRLLMESFVKQKGWQTRGQGLPRILLEPDSVKVEYDGLSWSRISNNKVSGLWFVASGKSSVPSGTRFFLDFLF